MLQILAYVILGLIALVTILIVLFLTLSMPVIIVWKFYRKFRYGLSLYD